VKTIVTAYGSYMTSSELADAVTGYGLALARSHSVDVVDLPFVAEDGSSGRVQLRVGWLSDMATVLIDGSHDELLELDAVLTIVEKTESLEGDRGTAFAEDDMPDFRSAEPNWEDVI
jgi:hypothetical protein